MPIVQTGNPVLRQKAKAVPKKEIGALRSTLRRMHATLAKEEHGVALAAPQIGVSKRLFIISEKVFADEDAPKQKHLVFINPELVRLSRAKKEMSEGCLSVRGTYGIVERHEKATVHALDEHGLPFTYHGSGLIAQIFQHEIDHLNGILYTDKAEQFTYESE